MLLFESGNRARGKSEIVRERIAGTNARMHEDDQQHEKYDLPKWSDHINGNQQKAYFKIREKDGSVNRCVAEPAGSKIEDRFVLCWRHVHLSHCSQRNPRALSQSPDHRAEHVFI